MEHRLGRVKLNCKYTDIVLSSAEWGICVGCSGARRTQEAEGERCQSWTSPRDSDDGGFL